MANAGTDANVHITLFGTKGDSGSVVLKDSQSFTNKFERGHTDIFNVETMDIGALKKVVFNMRNVAWWVAWKYDSAQIVLLTVVWEIVGANWS